MKRLISLLVCCFIVVFFSGCAQLIIAELEDRANEKGKQNTKTWATNNIHIGANEDDVLQRFGTPLRKEADFWIYPLPANVIKIPKDSNLFVVIFFSDEKVISWLTYSYKTGRFLEVSSQPSYKNITLGISKEAISVEQDKLVYAYKGKDVWLLLENLKVKNSFWAPIRGPERTMAAIVFQNEKVAIIFCFRGYEYELDPVVSPNTIIIAPDK